MKLEKLHAELGRQYHELVKLSRFDRDESLQRTYSLEIGPVSIDKTIVSVTMKYFQHDDVASSGDDPVWKAEATVMPSNAEVENVVKDFFMKKKSYSLSHFRELIFREVSLNSAPVQLV